ncbi:MAG TPA: pyruvate dehydrogenase (acetyl-transferring) E1 component subunit alpha [Pirellulales bacterium]|nr:pyruvate dehydrogenase (acetyl-transferring) E1 component subunit alpha [Pirellulales bacterium]
MPSEPATAVIEAQSMAAERRHALGLLRDMILIRRFEEKSAELYTLGKIHGFLHLYIGEEAVAVGALHALSADDAIVATYREHGHALVRGIPAGAVMAEMYGKANGCSRGRGGSMHLFDVSRRFYGGNAIVGGGLPIAVGLALADKLQHRRRVTACLFGDGAVAEGEFHESLNLAALWKLPVLFLCENNGYAMGTAIERHQSRTDIHAKAAGYGIPAEVVDGMDVLAVERAARQAVDAVHGGEPYFLEARTYRFRAHSMYDAELYRTKAEVEQWKKRDPITSFVVWLRERQWLGDHDLAEIESSVAAEVVAAVSFAEAGPWEPVEDLTKDVYTPVPS